MTTQILKRRVLNGKIVRRPFDMWGDTPPERLICRVHFEIIDGIKTPIYTERPRSQWDEIDKENLARFGKSCCPPGRCCSVCIL